MANPITDQMNTATARVNELLAGMARKRIATFEIGREATPLKIHELAYAVGEALGRNGAYGLLHCGHAESVQPMFLFATEWNIARCETCATERGRELGQLADSGGRPDRTPNLLCDFCDSQSAVPRPFAFGLGFYLMRGWACDTCLTAPVVGVPTRTPQNN